MTAIRLVITGEDDAHNSYIASDGFIEGDTASLLRGGDFTRLWGSEAVPVVPGPNAWSSSSPLFPAPGGVNAFVSRIPPASAQGDLVAGADSDKQAELDRVMPGLLERHDGSGSGFHQSDTVDIILVLSGEIELETTNGPPTLLSTGTVVVQMGTGHAWHNRTDDDVTLLCIVIGAARTPHTSTPAGETA
jgi:Cupin domain